MNHIAQWYEAPVNAPTAWMSASSTQLCASGCIDFYDNSTNSPTSWTWTFPGSDTPSSTAQNPGTVCWSSPGNYTVSFQACNAFGCNTQYVDIEVSNGASVSVNSPSICTGSSATLTANPSSPGGTFLWSPGGETTQSITVSPGSTTNYSVTYTMPGCVSSPALSTVTVVTGYNTSEDIDACQNSTVTFPDLTTQVITSSTSHSSLLQSVQGCDSTVVTNVTMVTAYNQSQNITTCENSTITYPDGVTETITSNTSHTSTLVSATGCDSIIVTNVSMTPTYSGSQNVSVCAGDSYIYPDGFVQTISTSTSHTSVLSGTAGCDSIIVTNVTASPSYSISETVAVCENTVYTYPDGATQTITSGTIHTSSLNAQTGCDSIIVTNVVVNPIYSQTQAQSICSGASYTYPDGTVHSNITANESYTSSLTSMSGCDSVINVNLNVVADISSTQNVSLCTGDNYTYPDGTVSNNLQTNESHVSTLQSVFGCDSIITSNITVNPVPVLTSNNETICEGDAAVLNATPSITGGTFLWMPDMQTTSSIIVGPNSTTTYTATYTLNGCESNQSVSVVTVNPMPIITVSESNNVLTSDQSGAVYQWLDCNSWLNINGENGVSYSPTVNGEYAVIIDLNGCIDTSSCMMISTIGINEVIGQNIQLYPNPAVDEIQIKGLENQTFDLEMTDINGKVILKIKKTEVTAIDVSTLDKGVYFIKLDEGELGTYRFVKQ